MTEDLNKIDAALLKERQTQTDVLLKEIQKDVKQLLYAHERGIGVMWTFRIFGILFMSTILYFVQDKIAGYEKWNYQEDEAIANIQKSQLSLSDRMSILEYKLNRGKQ